MNIARCSATGKLYKLDALYFVSDDFGGGEYYCKKAMLEEIDDLSDEGPVLDNEVEDNDRWRSYVAECDGTYYWVDGYKQEDINRIEPKHRDVINKKKKELEKDKKHWEERDEKHEKIKLIIALRDD